MQIERLSPGNYIITDANGDKWDVREVERGEWIAGCGEGYIESYTLRGIKRAIEQEASR